MLNGHEKILINHKLTALACQSDGAVWLGLSVVSLSSHSEAGHITMHCRDKSEYWEYDLYFHRWEKLAHKFGIRQVVTFECYMHTIRQVRNSCAHGLLLYDFRLPQAIRRGPAHYDPADRNNIIGSIRVIMYVMEQISANRANDMSREIKEIYNKLCKHSPNLKALIPDFSKI